MTILTPLGDPLNSSDSLFAIYCDSAYTYSDLYSRASFYASLITPASISVLIGTNTVDSIAFYLACLSVNSPIILLPGNITKSSFDSYLSSFLPSQIFGVTDESWLDGTHFSLSSTLYIAEGYRSEFPKTLPSLLLPTSGSTGSRKLVKVSSQNLAANTRSIIQYLSVEPTSRHICSLPLSYTYGLSCINTHVSVSASVVLNDLSIIDSQFWQLVEIWKPTTFSGVPYTYQVLSRFPRDFLSALPFKQYTQAGGKLSSSLVELFHDVATSAGSEFIVMYGQTEATARMSYVPSVSLPLKIGSIGIPIPGGSFSIDYTKNTPHINGLPTGELLYSGPNVTHGYAFSTEDICLSTNSPAALSTGDIAYVDSDGYYYITGRLARFAKVDGLRISLDEIESCINSIDVACVSDDKYIYIFHSPSVSQSFILESIKLTSSLPSRFFRFISIDQIPRNESGKVLYAELSTRAS